MMFLFPPATPLLTYRILFDLWPSDQPVGVEVTVISSDPHPQSQDTSSSLTASPCVSEQMQKKKKRSFLLRMQISTRIKICFCNWLCILVHHSPPKPRTDKRRRERKKNEGKKRSAAENRGGNGWMIYFWPCSIHKLTERGKYCRTSDTKAGGYQGGIYIVLLIVSCLYVL